MKKNEEKLEEFLNLMVDWQALETETVEYVNKEMPKVKNPLIKTMLKVLELEAEKHCVIQQMVVESVKKEAVHLSPDELDTLSGHINMQVEAGDKALSIAEAAFRKNDLFIPHYLITYLMADLKKQGSLLRQFEDELKTASIPTSVTSKIFSSNGK